jgi:hypothetical protein
MRLCAAMALAVLCTSVALRAQDNKAVPAGFRAFIVADDRYTPKKPQPKTPEDRDPRDRTNMMHNVIVEQGLHPVVVVFTRNPPGNATSAAKLAKELQPLLVKHKANNFAAYVVYLTLEKEYPQDDRYVENDPAKGFVREKEADAIRALATQLTTPRVVYGLAAGKSKQVEDWKIGDNDTVVVLYNKMQVVGRWEAKQGQSLPDDTIKAIVAAADAEGKKE